MFLPVVNDASLRFFFCSLYKCRVAHHTDESESVKIKLASRALRLRGARTQRPDETKGLHALGHGVAPYWCTCVVSLALVSLALGAGVLLALAHLLNMLAVGCGWWCGIDCGVAMKMSQRRHCGPARHESRTHTQLTRIRGQVMQFACGLQHQRVQLAMLLLNAPTLTSKRSACLEISS